MFFSRLDKQLLHCCRTIVGTPIHEGNHAAVAVNSSVDIDFPSETRRHSSEFLQCWYIYMQQLDTIDIFFLVYFIPWYRESFHLDHLKVQLTLFFRALFWKITSPQLSINLSNTEICCTNATHYRTCHPSVVYNIRQKCELQHITKLCFYNPYVLPNVWNVLYDGFVWMRLGLAGV